jgi:hypothetical protein
VTTRGAGRPTAGGYRLADGSKVPSVTTVTGRFKDSGGLVYRAKEYWHEAGRRGLPFSLDGYWGGPDKWGTDALEAGSVVHEWIENYLHDPRAAREFTGTDQATYQAALTGFEAFENWATMYELEVIETETPLVSEEYRFGGTLDCVARIGGEKTTLDWKTSGGAYPDYIAQIAAYRQLLRERDGDDAPASAMLLRVGKEHADFHLHAYPSSVLDMGWRWFANAREMYDLDKSLKKVAA